MSRIAMRPRWEDETLASGGRVVVYSGTRDELLAGGGTERVATDHAALEPLGPVARLSRSELAQVAKILGTYPRRAA